MKPAKIFKISLNMVKSNRLRSWLTIIGVVIGIASVMTVVTTGEYFQEQVTDTLEGLGSSTITIIADTPYQVTYEEEEGIQSPENEQTNEFIEDPDLEDQGKLTKKDIQTLEKIPEIEYINLNVEAYLPLNMGSEETNVRITGVDPRVWDKITTDTTAQGRMLKPGDRNVIVISDSLANEAFQDKSIMLNQMILLNEKSYRVVGILAKKEGLLGGISGMFVSDIYMPYEEAYDLRLDDEDPDVEMSYDSIEIKLYEGSDINSAIDKMDKQLQLSRRVDEESKDFYIFSPLEFIEGTSMIITGLTAFLAFIAGISLLVGSVGIANTMFTSVLEKTKEIGIMKAIGARNEDILMIFLCNSALIGLVGGIMGIIIGTTVVQVIVLAISMKLNVPFEFTLSLKATIIATVVSIVVGLIAGYMPAKSASKLNPVDALRYE
ncbi:MAG: ABC transporter permease [Methanolobus sp.]|nr:ABC transporter permease [Methanolobus sp.]